MAVMLDAGAKRGKRTLGVVLDGGLAFPARTAIATNGRNVRIADQHSLRTPPRAKGKTALLSDIGHIECFQHAMLLKAIAEIEAIPTHRGLKYIETAIKNYLPAGICHDIPGVGCA